MNQAHVSKLRINAITHFYYIKSTNISVNNCFSSTNIIWSCGYQNKRLFPIDDDFQSRTRQRWFSLWDHNVSFSYFLRTREGCMSTITKSGLITARTSSIKRAWGRLPLIGIERYSAKIDLAYLIGGLVVIIQSRPVHRILQRVGHTDLTGLVNSHLFHWSQIHAWLFDKYQSFIDCFLFLFWTVIGHFHFRRLRNISFGMAPRHFIRDGSSIFHFIKCTGSYQNGCNYNAHYITGCFTNS